MIEMTSGKAEAVAPPRCRPVSITGLDVMTPCGRGVPPLASAAFAGEPAVAWPTKTARAESDQGAGVLLARRPAVLVLRNAPTTSSREPRHGR